MAVSIEPHPLDPKRMSAAPLLARVPPDGAQLRLFGRIEIVLPGIQHRGQCAQTGFKLIHGRRRQCQPHRVRGMAGGAGEGLDCSEPGCSGRVCDCRSGQRLLALTLSLIPGESNKLGSIRANNGAHCVANGNLPSRPSSPAIRLRSASVSAGSTSPSRRLRSSFRASISPG